MAKIAYLKAYTFEGYSFDAIHWYGDIMFRDATAPITVQKLLTEQSAAKLRERLDSKWIKAGDLSSHLDTEAEVIEWGKRLFIQQGLGDILILGSSTIAEPQPVLIAREDIKAKLQGFYDRAEAVVRWSAEHEVILDEYWEYFCQLESEANND